MSGLSQDDIKRLLAKPVKTKTASGKKLDLSVRTAETWFAANHKLFDEEKRESTSCSNPECENPKRMCVAIPTAEGPKFTCRICFLAGYLLEIDNLV